MQVKFLVQGHSATPRQPRPIPKTYQSQSRRPQSTALWRPACIWSIYFRCIGTLRVVTARELVVLSGSFTSYSMLVRTAPPFTWSCEPREIHNLQRWRARSKSPQASPAHDGDWTWGRRVTGAHATTCMRYCSCSHYCMLLYWYTVHMSRLLNMYVKVLVVRHADRTIILRY